MSTLGVQYVHTVTPSQRNVVTGRSLDHGVSSQPSPLTRATPASAAAPSGSGGPIQQAAAPTGRTTLAVHKDIYADGWNNGESTSSQDEEVLQRSQTPMRSELEEKGASPEGTTTNLRTRIGQKDIKPARVVKVILVARRWSIRDGERDHGAILRWKERKK